jgi:hypothetical protein
MTYTTPTAPVSEATRQAEALEWLARRLRWDRLLAELRETSDAIDITDDVDEAA